MKTPSKRIRKQRIDGLRFIRFLRHSLHHRIWERVVGISLMGGFIATCAAVLVAYATILPELELTTRIFLVVPLRLKAKHLAYGATALAIVLLCIDRTRTVSHSAYLGGCAAGWLYAHLLGFGRTSFLQRHLQQRRAAAARYERLSIDELMNEEIDPLLEKISIYGLVSLTRKERRNLCKARETILQKTHAA